MIRASLAAAVLSAAVLASPAAAQQAASGGSWDARVVSATGTVTVIPADGSGESAATAGMPLDSGDRVVVAQGASAELSLDGESLLDLQAGADFTLTRLDKTDSSFTLSVGSLLAKIQKLAGWNMRVRTPSAVAAVRGTEFGVDVDADQQSHFGVFDEGRVDVTAGGGEQLLTPNQETFVRRGGRPARAFALKRFAARRRMMRAQIRRLRAVRAHWRSMSRDERRALRRKIMESRRIRRERRRRENGRRRAENTERRKEMTVKRQEMRRERATKRAERRRARRGRRRTPGGRP